MLRFLSSCSVVSISVRESGSPAVASSRNVIASNEAAGLVDAGAGATSQTMFGPAVFVGPAISPDMAGKA